MECNATNVYKYGMVEIVVRRPRLDEQERHKRESAICRALATYGKDMYQKCSERMSTEVRVNG